ncbi:MAG TPA: hypothetical protein VNT79_18610 [Phycisphaerae bacterium]|nr:hypothetical protein [Phycisphaerae bacterium]
MIALALIGGVLLASMSDPAAASTVVAMNLLTLADHAGQVVIGDVQSVRSYWAEKPRRIETEVVFSNVTYLKGAIPSADKHFSLVLPGGQIGSLQMRLCCAPEFKVGQRRLLFLLPTYKTFPTVGLDQGAFEIIRDAQGVDRVHYSKSNPVTRIDDEKFVITERRPTSAVHGHLVHAHNAVVRDANGPPDAAQASVEGLSLQEFLQILQPILDASRDFKLTEPAGRRVLIDYQAVPLRTATAQAGATRTAERSSARSNARQTTPRESKAKRRTGASQSSANSRPSEHAGTKSSKAREGRP